MKYLWVQFSPLAEVLASSANAAGNKQECTTKKLTTYKRVLTDHYSWNLELQSHPLTVVYTGRVE
jgi:hypothetical protein